MWHHTLVALLAVSTALPTQVMFAAAEHSMTVEKVKKIADDILEKLEQYGPLIIKLIAPFVAKKLVEIGVIKIMSVAGNSIGKREAVVEGATETEAAEKYLNQKFHELIQNLKEEFHKRIDMQAVNDKIDDWQSTITELAKTAKDKLWEFVHQFGSFSFEGYVRGVLDRLSITKREIEKRSVTRTEWDHSTLNNYDKMLEELRQVLEKRVGHKLI